MTVETHIPLLEEILSEWQETIGEEYEGYRNHVYRMINFCWRLKACDAQEREKIIIAGAFHDIGIWIEDTVDYIPPSIPPALEYLRRHQLETWSPDIKLMISEHHKITPYQDPRYPLVEVFRKGDLIDVSLGLVTFDLPAGFVAEVRTAIPNARFHRQLAQRAARWFVKHPLNPAPMMKW